MIRCFVSLLLLMAAIYPAWSGINPGVPWPATDALNRRLPLADEVGAPRADKFVGIFYFLWHNEPLTPGTLGDGPFDISRIMAKDPDALKKPDSPLWGKIGTSHYWGPPLFGYYRGNDPWILRRHAQLLADAGIDTLIFDTTNARTYPDVYFPLCQTFREIRQAGGRTPQIAFMVNTEAGRTAREIFDRLYKPGLYRELWFYWKEKPLLICDPAAAEQELRDFFTLRRAHWPFHLTNTPFAWHWEATYPQPYGYTDDPNRPEQVNVSVAQNLRAKDGKVTNMSSGDARGRSFHTGSTRPRPGEVDRGLNFAEQWKRPFEVDPPFVMVTGWNEWIAGRWGSPDGPITFVDQFDQEHSRDIEPMKGGHGDNYYWQLIANVRRFKGTPPIPAASRPLTIRMANSFAQWDAVQPEFSDSPGDTTHRAFVGVGGTSYTNNSGRNDLLTCKVARDSQNLYFYAETRDPIILGTNCLWLFIDADQDPATGWHGYDFLLNRSMQSGRTSVERYAGPGWTWNKVTEVTSRYDQNKMQLKVPRSALGLPRNTTRANLDFKWTDNLQNPGDIMDFYQSGDVAPEARFNFRYTAP